MVFALFFASPAAYADKPSDYDTQKKCESNGYKWNDNQKKCVEKSNNNAQESTSDGCDYQGAIIKVNCDKTADDGSVEGTAIWAILNWVISIMTGLVAVAALGGVVYGAVLYTSAGGSAEQVKKASEIFVNVSVGILAYGLMYVLLNFLIPGGVFE